MPSKRRTRSRVGRPPRLSAAAGAAKVNGGEHSAASRRVEGRPLCSREFPSRVAGDEAGGPGHALPFAPSQGDVGNDPSNKQTQERIAVVQAVTANLAVVMLEKESPLDANTRAKRLAGTRSVGALLDAGICLAG